MDELTTPRAITKDVLTLCAKVSPGQEPDYVSVRPGKERKVNYCFQNVVQTVKDRGGSMQCGWVIWEIPGRLLEAEFHACWLSPEGELVDVTEKPDAEAAILFLPDPDKKWERKLVRNIRMPLIDDDATRFDIAFNERMEDLKEKYWTGEGADIPQHEIEALYNPSLKLL